MNSPSFNRKQNFVPKNLKNFLTQDEYEMVKNVAIRRNAYNQMPVIAWTMGFLNIYQLDALLSHPS
jgi:hypothetical protein